ncbi:hypothetical protein GCM10027578_35640 [Spirosoma luteolum]
MLTPSREQWDIEGNWQECGDILFIDSQYMPDFAPWADFSVKTLKFINYNRAAVRMSFFTKHKYWLKKPHDLTTEEREAFVTELLNNLLLQQNMLRSKLDGRAPLPRAEARRKLDDLGLEMNHWRQVLSRIDDFDLAVSTYQRGYAYLYINLKFRLPTSDYDNTTEHLLNHTRDRLGNITQRKQNIVFVDMGEIFRSHPLQHKEIENYLNRFPLKSSIGPRHLYARPRADLAANESFGLTTPERDAAKGDNGQLALFSDL